MKPILFTLSFILGLHAIYAQQGVDITCLEVQASGEVQVNWSNSFEVALNPSLELINYVIYRSDAANPTFTQVAFASAGTFTTLDQSANANNTKYTYQIVASYQGLPSCPINPGGLPVCNSPQGNTVSTLFLQAYPTTTMNGLQTGYAAIEWNHPGNVSLGTTSYSIDRNYYSNPASLAFVSTITNNDSIWQDPDRTQGPNCSDVHEYRVRVSHPSGCQHVSNLSDVTIADCTPPTAPSINYASVNPISNEVELVWSNNNIDSNQVEGFLPIVNGVCVGTLPNNSSQYSFPGTAPDTDVVSFNIQAFDDCPYGSAVCGVIGPQVVCGIATQISSSSDVFSTSFLETELTNFDASIELTWTAPQGWSDSASTQYIFVSNDGGQTYTFLDSIAPGITDYSFTDFNANDTTYCFYVAQVAASNGMEINSNSSCESGLSLSTSFENKIPGFNFYPNPVKNELILNTNEKVSVQLYNMLGDLIFNDLLLNQTTWNLTDLSNGVYQIRVYNQKGESMIKQLVIKH